MLTQKENPPSTPLVPMRWPSTWQDGSALALLEGSRINCLLIPRDSGYDNVVAPAVQAGFTIMDATVPPSGAQVVKGMWPGVKLTESGKLDQASAGPTGDPWVDSNGWRVRLAAATNPGRPVWIDAAPAEPRLRPESYVMAVADAAAYGGNWIVSLDDDFAAAITAKNPEALQKWKKLAAATRFFASHQAWSGYEPQAVLGVVSDFRGTNQSLSNELLNLVARTNQQYRIVLKEQASEASFRNLKAAIYVDVEPPSAALKQQLLAFVQNGGLLIAAPVWGEVPGASAKPDEHLPYTAYTLGKGRVMLAQHDLKDPYLIAQDSMVMISHRHDLLRFWNGGAIGSYLTTGRGGQRTLLQLLFYAGGRTSTTSVRVAGRYKVAMLSTIDQPVPQSVETEFQKDAVELHLPPVSQFAAVELQAEV